MIRDRFQYLLIPHLRFFCFRSNCNDIVHSFHQHFTYYFALHSLQVTCLAPLPPCTNPTRKHPLFPPRSKLCHKQPQALYNTTCLFAAYLPQRIHKPFRIPIHSGFPSLYYLLGQEQLRSRGNLFSFESPAWHSVERFRLNSLRGVHWHNL